MIDVGMTDMKKTTVSESIAAGGMSNTDNASMDVAHDANSIKMRQQLSHASNSKTLVYYPEENHVPHI